MFNKSKDINNKRLKNIMKFLEGIKNTKWRDSYIIFG